MSNDMMFRRGVSNLCDLTGKECSRVGCTSCTMPFVYMAVYGDNAIAKYFR